MKVVLLSPDEVRQQVMPHWQHPTLRVRTIGPIEVAPSTPRLFVAAPPLPTPPEYYPTFPVPPRSFLVVQNETWEQFIPPAGEHDRVQDPLDPVLWRKQMTEFVGKIGGLAALNCVLDDVFRAANSKLVRQLAQTCNKEFLELTCTRGYFLYLDITATPEIFYHQGETMKFFVLPFSIFERFSASAAA